MNTILAFTVAASRAALGRKALWMPEARDACHQSCRDPRGPETKSGVSSRAASVWPGIRGGGRVVGAQGGVLVERACKANRQRQCSAGGRMSRSSSSARGAWISFFFARWLSPVCRPSVACSMHFAQPQPRMGDHSIVPADQRLHHSSKRDRDGLRVLRIARTQQTHAAE